MASPAEPSTPPAADGPPSAPVPAAPEGAAPAPAPPATPAQPEAAAAVSSAGAHPHRGRAPAPLSEKARRNADRWVHSTPLVRVSTHMAWLLVLVASVAVVALGFFIWYTRVGSREDPSAPAELGSEYSSARDRFSLRPPRNWRVKDCAEAGATVAFAGESDSAAPNHWPLIVAGMQSAPGPLSAYVQEHKARTEREDKSLRWIGKDGEDCLGGLPTARLEYEYTDPEDGTVMHALQYIVYDDYVFYRITCVAPAVSFAKYRKKFEASAASFHPDFVPVEITAAPPVKPKAKPAGN